MSSSPAREVHRRLRRLRALAREAARLASLAHAPGLACWLDETQPTLATPLEAGAIGWVHVALPALGYHRQVAVRDYEWRWLRQQPGLRGLLAAAPPPSTPQEGPHATHP